MVFSSTIFLFLFLPCVLAAYFLTPRKLGNLVLLLASLLFYAWGETFYVGIMLLSIASNFVFGRWISKHGKTSKGRWALGSAIAVNLGILWVFKYANFVVDNVNTLLGWFGSAPILLEPVHLPIGISFFTLQAISFLMDVYRGDARPPRNVIDLALYISLFPQLIAGPIVRYQQLAEQLRHRTHSFEKFSGGVLLFQLGLAKKLLLADPAGRVADAAYAISTEPRIRKTSVATSTRPMYLPITNCRRVSGFESTVRAVRPSISSATATLAVQITTSRARSPGGR